MTLIIYLKSPVLSFAEYNPFVIHFPGGLGDGDPQRVVL